MAPELFSLLTYLDIFGPHRFYGRDSHVAKTVAVCVEVPSDKSRLLCLHVRAVVKEPSSEGCASFTYALHALTLIAVYDVDDVGGPAGQLVLNLILLHCNHAGKAVCLPQMKPAGNAGFVALMAAWGGRFIDYRWYRGFRGHQQCT